MQESCLQSYISSSSDVNEEKHNKSASVGPLPCIKTNLEEISGLESPQKGLNSPKTMKEM